MGLLKLLVGEYRLEQTFKRRERGNKSHACQPLLGAVESVSVFRSSWVEGRLLLKESCCEPLLNIPLGQFLATTGALCISFGGGGRL